MNLTSVVCELFVNIMRIFLFVRILRSKFVKEEEKQNLENFSLLDTLKQLGSWHAFAHVSFNFWNRMHWLSAKCAGVHRECPHCKFSTGMWFLNWKWLRWCALEVHHQFYILLPSSTPLEPIRQTYFIVLYCPVVNFDWSEVIGMNCVRSVL